MLCLFVCYFVLCCVFCTMRCHFGIVHLTGTSASHKRTVNSAQHTTHSTHRSGTHQHTREQSIHVTTHSARSFVRCVYFWCVLCAMFFCVPFCAVCPCAVFCVPLCDVYSVLWSFVQKFFKSRFEELALRAVAADGPPISVGSPFSFPFLFMG